MARFLTVASLMLSALSTSAIANPVARRSCTDQQKIDACRQEIATIRSHMAADAAKIPLAPIAIRNFYITPNEAPYITLPPINVGVTADTVRAELVALATVLNAGVPEGSDSYIVNDNGTVTSDFIQTDQIALPYAYVREIHEFNDACQITKITGYVHAALVAAA